MISLDNRQRLETPAFTDCYFLLACIKFTSSSEKVNKSYPLVSGRSPRSEATGSHGERSRSLPDRLTAGRQGRQESHSFIKRRDSSLHSE
jgi:hypothetical protein